MQERMNYSCIEFTAENPDLDKSENLSLNYLYHVLLMNNISEEEIQNFNNLNQLNFLKSFSEKAILSRKLNYTINDCSRYILEKNDLQILIEILSNAENHQTQVFKDNIPNHQSIEEFTAMLSGVNKNKEMSHHGISILFLF